LARESLEVDGMIHSENVVKRCCRVIKTVPTQLVFSNPQPTEYRTPPPQCGEVARGVAASIFPLVNKRSKLDVSDICRTDYIDTIYLISSRKFLSIG
jgi:hypothetical protein